MRTTSHIALVTRPPARPSLFLTLTDEEGRKGLGEASPLPPFSSEDIDACELALTNIGTRIGPIDDQAPPLEAVSTALQHLEHDLNATPAARFALETALFDLVGKQRGLSVATCLGGPHQYDTVPVNGLLIASGNLASLADRAATLAAQGILAIKIKLRSTDDAGFARELTALHAVRERLPLPFELRLDPNAAWNEAEARQRLIELAPIAPRFVEQPVAPHRLHHLDHLYADPTSRTPVPWAADESLAFPELIDPLLTAGGCAAFILKPAILGGLLRARELAIRAQEHGIDVVVTHLFDGPVAMAAACELALSLPRPPLACGLDRHEGLAAWPAIEIPQLARRGLISASNAPGLGLQTFGEHTHGFR